MQDLTTKTVREIALEMPITTRIFEEFKIDYCCGGRKIFAEACWNAGSNPEIVLQKINKILETNEKNEFDWLAAASLAEIVDYIEEKHHTFTKDELEHLTPLMEKVVRAHGGRHPELFEIKETFQALSDDLTPHLMKEEMILFPYIRDLEAKHTTGLAISLPPFGTINNPVRMMMMEHDAAGDLLRSMRALSNDYKLPEGACPSYTGLYHRFEALERDLHQHIHLENNLLFPKAIKLEESCFEPIGQ